MRVILLGRAVCPLSRGSPERLGGLVKGAISSRLRAMEVSPLLGHALASAINEDRHVPMLEAPDEVAASMLAFLGEDAHELRDDVRLRVVDDA